MNVLVQAVAVAGLISTTSSAMFAQPDTKPAFDVASVKPNLTGVNGGSLIRSGGRITLENISLRECIGFAYGIPAGRDYELSGPGWLDAEKFDMSAKFPPETSRDRIRVMLQTLLAERFGLKTHTENRKLPSYALVVGKRGPKLQAANTPGDGAFIFGEDHVTFRAFSISGLADRLSGPVFKLDRPVVDMTGIKGDYDFTLKWAPDDASADGHSGASIFTALQEQLGLKLEPRNIAFRILVVDYADKVPTSN
jgi:uncharacterized protein (TIGR03435 family)